MLAVGISDCQQRGAKKARSTGLQARWGVAATIQGRPGHGCGRRIAGNKKARIPGENARPGSTQPGKTAQSVIRGFCRSTREAESRHPCRRWIMVGRMPFGKMSIAGKWLVAIAID